MKTILSILFLFTVAFAQAQNPFIRKISYLDGLTSDVVYDLFVNKEGLLYLGTDKGLMTYNGVHFEQVGALESLGSSISSIDQDASGKIWCRNFSNQLFYVEDNKLVEDVRIKNLIKESNSNLLGFSIYKDVLYVLTSSVIYRYQSGKITQVFKIDKDLLGNFVSIVFDPVNKKLYAASTNHIFVFQNDILIQKIKNSGGQKILEVFKGDLAYSTKSLDKNCVVGNKTIFLNKFNLDKTFLNRFSATKDHLWLCTNKGLYEFDPKKGAFTDGFLKNSRITDVVQDLEGNHWISSLEDGLYMLPNLNIHELGKNSLEKMSFTCVAKGPNGNYFFGSKNGLVEEYSIKGKKIREYQTNWDNNIEFINFMSDTIMTNYGFFKIGISKIISNDVYFGKYLDEDDKGNLLIAGSSFGGLMAKSMVEKPNFSNGNNKFKLINYGKKINNTLVFRNKRTRTVLFNSVQKEYYYGFIDGLFVYDSNGNETEIKSDENEPIIAVKMLLNSDGSIWIATAQRGVFLIKNKKVLRSLSTKNGLSDNNCVKIFYEDSTLWMITETGFDFYDAKTNRLNSAEINLCFKGVGINDMTVLNDLVVLATNKGIYYFDKKVLKQEVVPDFKLTEFLVNNKKIDLKDNLVLNYNENNINIKFNTIYYKSLGNYQYRYRLKGLEDKWLLSSSSAKNINFLALNPGQYKFQIHIKMGDKYTPIQEIEFEVRSPFWFQPWFLIVIVLAIISLLYFVYRWTEIKTIKSEELKEQLALSQLTALRSQMNPHFIFNVLNAVQGLIYSNQKSKASDYLSSFSDLMRRILDSSDKNEVTLDKEFETIDLYITLEKARFDNDFEYKISFPEDVDLAAYSIPSMIIQPFVENAIKHGLMHKKGLKLLDIKAELFDDVWCFTIDDNGVGRRASEIINQKIKKHISFATKAIDNRIKLINKIADIAIDIEVIDKKTLDNEPLGTRIKIYITVIS